VVSTSRSAAARKDVTTPTARGKPGSGRFAADRRAPTPTAAAELASPSREELMGRLGECTRALSREARRQIEYAMQAVDALARRLVHPAERLRSYQQLVAQLRARMAFGLSHNLRGFAGRLERLQVALAGLSPEGVLGRGYSITRTADGKVVSDAAKVGPGERLVTTLARGWLESEVKGKG
jgi:exodeoxyribonuclease VII large subunit